MAQHTPGPWRVGYNDGSGQETITTVAETPHKYGSFPTAIAVVRWGCGCCKDDDALTDEEQANARLIAAAPELFAAVKVMLLDSNIAQWLRTNDLKAYDQAWHAIEKAEKGTPPSAVAECEDDGT